MFVRVLTLDGIDASKFREFGEAARERTRPILQGLEGYQGAMQMLDRDGRRFRTAVFFENEDNIRAAEPTFESMPQQLPEELRAAVGQAQRTVDVFEVMATDRITLG
jgi:hypothetical protein